jgi:hypothetical protein
MDAILACDIISNEDLWEELAIYDRGMRNESFESEGQAKISVSVSTNIISISSKEYQSALPFAFLKVNQR